MSPAPPTPRFSLPISSCVGGSVAAPATPSSGQLALRRHARRLAWAGNAWHLIELAVALAAGVAAGSVALIGFGADSAIEILSGTVVVWLFSSGRAADEPQERRARMLIAGSYMLLCAYILAASTHDLIAGQHPRSSWLGVALAALAAVGMPLLARAKRSLGARLGSAAAISESKQNMICAYLAIALLAGLLANALAGWWWADPVAALVIALLAAHEANEAWHGRECACR